MEILDLISFCNSCLYRSQIFMHDLMILFGVLKEKKMYKMVTSINPETEHLVVIHWTTKKECGNKTGHALLE